MKFEQLPKDKKFQNLTNQKFNYLLVLGYAGKFGNGKKQRTYWWCQCDCGVIKKASSCNLKNNSIQSCGCHTSELIKKGVTIHNMSKTIEYSSYHNAKMRCDNSNYKLFKDYGGRGIKFLFNSFEEFYEHLGPKPEPKSNYSVERIDNNGNYEIGNVKWEIREKQNKNKRSNIWIKINNEIKCIADWCKIYKINQSSVFMRMKYGWCDVCSVIIPVRKGKCNHI